MAKERSRVVDFAVYVLIRSVVCLLQALSLEKAYAVADGLAWLAYRLDKRHREVARDNLQKSFPGRYAEAELQALVRGVYRHFCRLVVELTHLPRRMHASTWRHYFELTADRRLLESLLSGRPLMIITGHFGNWEMAGYALGLLGFKTYAVARDLDNVYLDDYLRRFRQSTGQQILSKKGDFDRMQSILDRGGVLATLADQDAGQRGLFVDFFGRPASTHKAMALMCLEQRVPLLVVGVPRVGASLHYRVEVGDLILPEEYDRRSDAVRAITQRFTTALEGLVRTAPGQYFWLHRRWKHQPLAKKARRVA